MKQLNNHGDTIVEVLIAILVVSSILAGGFVSARRSQSAIRSTQERVEALKVAEGQLERLKAAATSTDSPVFSMAAGTDTFCLDASNGKQAVSLVGLGVDDFSGYNSCKSTPTGVDYFFVVERQVATNTFTVYTRWQGLNGTGNQELKLAVRIDP